MPTKFSILRALTIALLIVCVGIFAACGAPGEESDPLRPLPDLAPCAGREFFKFEGTVLNAPEPGHFMPQCLEQSSDFTVFPLNQDHFQM